MKKLENQQVRFLEGIKSMEVPTNCVEDYIKITYELQRDTLPINPPAGSCITILYASHSHTYPILWSVLDAQPDESSKNKL